MKLLSYHYHLKIRMESPIQAHRFTLRCTPLSDARQRILRAERFIAPADFLSESRDGWGNALIYGCCRGGHTDFEANICGQAAVGLAACVPSANIQRDSVFLYPTALTAPDDAIRDFAAGLPWRQRDGVRQAQAVMEAVYNAMRYTPGVTTVNTSAAQAFANRQGVCQDYAHVMLSVIRSRGIPCRYVVGMLMGEGKSHAWVEVLIDGCWYAFDPTNCQIVSDSHIKLSHGRDYRDCAINRGVFRGFAAQQTDISVVVSEVL